MRSLLAHLALLAGCAVVPSRYEAVRGELRRDDRAHPSAPDPDHDRSLAALAAAPWLDRAALITTALARNRDVEAMRQAWHAAAAEVRQVTALDDPMVSYAVAPLSIAAAHVRFGEEVELRQALPFPGKRALAGEAALDDADAMHADLRAGQLAIAERASQLFDDAYVAARALEVNDHHRALVERMAQLATARVASSRGSAQDALQAEVELGQLAQERVMLET
ncbi:MAG TPA: TolC family protein, partial [Kofleriaceae bacterium]|nr:TolC family protein [Kofleriaceae bacterium]